MELSLVGNDLAASCLKLLASLASWAGLPCVARGIHTICRMDGCAGVEATLHFDKFWLVCFWKGMKTFDIKQ